MRTTREPQAKGFYEGALKALGVGRSNLHASFDPFDPETSRSSLYSEVLEKTRQHVESLERELNRSRTEALYAELVVSADVSELSAQIRRTGDELSRGKKQVQAECVRQQECFAALRDTLSELGAATREAAQSLQGILQKRPPTPQEQVVLDLLQDPRGTDLSVVIASRLAEEGSAFSLDGLMRTVTSLFKKNQIVIRLEKRR